ncbi:MAG: YegS/Rv2252/BmrU family lipid kinase [Candidatus Eisenbacteria bacterium]|nr:YegS/Rv2252/BmrU family lipid kinase [Candidatus Eisenbacteria bacterium]
MQGTEAGRANRIADLQTIRGEKVSSLFPPHGFRPAQRYSLQLAELIDLQAALDGAANTDHHLEIVNMRPRPDHRARCRVVPGRDPQAASRATPCNERRRTIMPTSRKAILIVNPAAGRRTGREVAEKLAAELEEAGWDCSQFTTKEKNDGCRAAQRAMDQGADAVVAVGGDGTIQEVLSGAARAKSDIPVALLATGTANVITAALGLPEDIEEVARMIDDGRSGRIDLGYLPDLDRHFVLMATIGYPTKLVDDTSRPMKNRLGFGAYVLSALRNLGRLRETLADFKLDDHRLQFKTTGAIVANIGRIENLGIEIAPASDPSDGRFDVVVFKTHSFWGWLLSGIKILARRHDQSREIIYRRAARVELAAQRAMPVQVDGESIGETPVLAECLPRAVRLVKP